jgi:hypothetical protein
MRRQNERKIGDLVRFKLADRNCLIGPGNARDLYPYKFEVGVVVPGPFPGASYVSFPSRPKPTSYITEQLELLSASR